MAPTPNALFQGWQNGPNQRSIIRISERYE